MTSVEAMLLQEVMAECFIMCVIIHINQRTTNTVMPLLKTRLSLLLARENLQVRGLNTVEVLVFSDNTRSFL